MRRRDIDELEMKKSLADGVSGTGMTDEEIKKGLECCSFHIGSDCKKCPYLGEYCCADIHQIDAYKLIDRLQEENERLIGELEHLKGSMTLVGCIKQSEAGKETNRNYDL